MDRRFMFLKKMSPGGCLPLPLGYIHAYDPGMTLTYFMARSAEVAYPRSQVSVNRTIGPLVKNLLCILY